MSETITGKLKKVIWRSLENDYTIAAFINTSDSTEFIATGDLFKPAEGITYEMDGKWEEHHKYGQQFKIQSYCVQEPADVGSITAYLEKYVAGVGPVMADVLVEKYGKYAIRIMKNKPERVANEVKGITYKKALAISAQLQEGDKQQKILMKLEGLFSKVKGLPRNLAQNVIAMYGLTAYEVVKNNPYALIDMTRIGFVLADKIAMACGIKSDAPERIKQGILYVIRQVLQETGDIWLKPGMVGNNLLKMISGIEPTVVIDIILNLVEDKVLAEHEGYITLTQFSDDEDCIADSVVRFLT